MVRNVVLLCLFCVGVGCGVKQPTLQYIGAVVTQSTQDAFKFDVEFEISNKNDFPLQLLLYNYEVTSGGRTIYVGFASAEKTIPYSLSITNSIPVVIPREFVVDQDELSWQLSGTLGYIPPKAMSETLVDMGIWKPMVSVRAHDVLQVPAIVE
jgi:hypothetical protein